MNISDYYMRCFLYEPPLFENREFSIVKKGEKMVWRHLGFANIDKLRAFLIEIAPRHVYFSSAKYEYPWIQNMEVKKKGWLGTDLVFDIDKDQLKVPTLKEAKRQSLKLIKILRKDFGLVALLWVFSGSRGYHVHCHDECVQKLNSPERREIADYFQEFHPGTEENNRNYVQIDAPVTCDVTRLMRLPGTIHGGSGLVCDELVLPKAKM